MHFLYHIRPLGDDMVQEATGITLWDARSGTFRAKRNREVYMIIKRSKSASTKGW